MNGTSVAAPQVARLIARRQLQQAAQQPPAPPLRQAELLARIEQQLSLRGGPPTQPEREGFGRWPTSAPAAAG